MMKADTEIEPFSKFIEALDPWLGQVVVVGGWAHRLYRLDPRARTLTHLPLTTLDGDVAVPSKLKVEGSTVRERLLKAGFKEEFIGEDRPPATHYHCGQAGGFYVEFLSPLVGSEYDRSGKRKATQKVSGVSSQQLRYIEILMIAPWKIELGKGNGYSFTPAKKIQVANPTSFLAQKILIHQERDYKDRAKDLLYMHDTIELFSEHLGELREIFGKDVLPTLHARRIAELTGAADGLLGNVEDTIREAVLMATGRKLSPERLAETARAGLKEIFRH
jgi:Nucleotidyltransferase